MPLTERAKAKLIVALDVDSAAAARDRVAELRDTVGMFKIGLQLFTAAGPAIVRELSQTGLQIFLDLKFHDIPQTVALAGIEAARLGVFMFNVHAAGGSEMMRRTAEAVTETAAREGLPPTKIIAVTVLTSLDQAALQTVGVDSAPEPQVLRLVDLAQAAGLDGVVASPRETAAIRQAVNSEFLVVTPGVRQASAAYDDQVRVFTPDAAIGAGADYLVVGRPILRASDRVVAAQSIVEEIESALDECRAHNAAGTVG